VEPVTTLRGSLVEKHDSFVTNCNTSAVLRRACDREITWGLQFPVAERYWTVITGVRTSEVTVYSLAQAKTPTRTMLREMTTNASSASTGKAT
jgi:hypothetical protein